METLQMNPQNFVSKARFMNSIASKLRPKLLYATSSQLKALCTTTTTTTSSSSLTLNSTAISSVNELIHEPLKKSAVKNTSSVKVRVKVKNKASITAQFKDNWLASISCPFPEDKSEESAVINGGDTIPSPRGDAEDKIVIGIDPDLSGALAVLKTDAQGCTTAESVKGLDGDVVKDMDKSEESTVINGSDTIPSPRGNAEDKIVIGIDPDLSGALAVLKTDAQGCTTAEVFDSPLVKLMVGKSVRRRLDTSSIVKLLQSFDAPVGTIAYLEQSIPFPQNGKQSWWSGGFGYGLWIGVLVASGFSVVPVPSYTWKSEFELAGKQISKDDSRELASTLFPSMSSLFKRKKDHGRAEALLIAAYGKGMKIKSKPVNIADELVPTLTCSTISPHF